MKTKRKLKKKVWIPIIICLLGIVGLGAFYKILYDKKMSTIQKHYASYVITTKKANLYNKKKQIIGTITKDYTLELENYEKSLKKQYFQIKDTNYYIYYEDVKETEEKEKKETKNYELPSSQTLTGKSKTTLYQDEKEILSLTEIQLPFAYETEENYYVFFQRQLLKLKKDSSLKIKDSIKNKEKEAEHISILYYEDIKESCDDKFCTTAASFEEQISHLLENGYYTITKEDLENFLNHYTHLKEKAILISTSNSIDSIKNYLEEKKIIIENIYEENNLHYISTNKTNTKDSTKDLINRYQIKNNTSKEDILKMAQGEAFPIIIDNQAIAVLNYHFFFDQAGGEVCTETICLDTTKLREHFEYLKENHYKTLTMNEFKRWMYGEIELPTKSVLVTVDDGAMGTGKHNGNKLNPMLEEYNLRATLFLITGWWDIENYRSPNLDIQSHTNDMHLYGTCGRGQLNCATYEQAKEDLERSIQIIGNTDSFCFPFYMYSDTSIKAVQDAGFQLAFVGGNRKATRNSNKFLVPRYPILNDITMNRFIEIIS